MGHRRAKKPVRNHSLVGVLELSANRHDFRGGELDGRGDPEEMERGAERRARGAGCRDEEMKPSDGARAEDIGSRRAARRQNLFVLGGR